MSSGSLSVLKTPPKKCLKMPTNQLHLEMMFVNWYWSVIHCSSFMMCVWEMEKEPEQLAHSTRNHVKTSEDIIINCYTFSLWMSQCSLLFLKADKQDYSHKELYSCTGFSLLTLSVNCWLLYLNCRWKLI